MPSIKTILSSAILTAGALSIASASAQTTLRYAVGFPSGAGPEAAQVYAKAVKKYTKNTINLKVFDLSLLNLAEMSGGLKQGIADIGYVLTPYSPAEFPHMNMTTELSMLTALENDPSGKAGLAFSGALNELMFTKCPECNADFERQNQVFTGAGGSSSYMLLCTKPITTLADIKGARLRTGGAAWARWAGQVGASPVSMPGNEIFEAMKQKVVDCSIQSAPELSGLNLKEVTTDFTPNLPGGTFSGAMTNFNRDTWKKLTAEERRGMLRAATVMSAEATFRYFTYAKRDMEQLIAKGGRSHMASPDLLKASRAAIEADLPYLGATYSKQHGIKNADQLIAAMRPLLTKWTKLVEPINNAEELADLYWNEIQSKVDVNTHGMK
jgi:TRAP-type C4-dicarboxylate transport system substrate-binding protein